MTVFQPATVGLIILAALGYSFATIGMKMGSVSLTLVAITIIAAGLLVAAMAEVTILRSADLGAVYIAIIGIETLLVLTYAWWIGEGLNLRQLGGAGMVLAGLVLVGH